MWPWEYSTTRSAPVAARRAASGASASWRTSLKKRASSALSPRASLVRDSHVSSSASTPCEKTWVGTGAAATPVRQSNAANSCSAPDSGVANKKTTRPCTALTSEGVKHVARGHLAVVGEGLGWKEVAQLTGGREVLLLVGEQDLLDPL